MISKYLRFLFIRLLNRGLFKKQFLSYLPEAYREAAKLIFYYTPHLKSDEKKLGKKIESFRSKISDVHQEKEVASYSSPHSGTFSLKEGSEHAKPGPHISSKIENTMKTGSNIYKGILLRRIVEGSQCKRVLELGTNTGFSGCYFISNSGTELVTIEGSQALCEIADKNMSRIGSNYTIMNCLFDEGIDNLIADNQKFDCVFIDGQHEREATIHYAKRVAPLMSDNATYIFDDIYWSEDMNQAWKELCYSFNFAEAVDLFLVGVLKSQSGNKPTMLYDIGDYAPRPTISRKGW